MTFYLGLDPGNSGGAAVIGETGKVLIRPDRSLNCFKFDKATEHEISEWFKTIVKLPDLKCALEKVHSMPGWGVAACFTFGKNYGFLVGLLVAHNIPFIEVRSNIWQKDLKCLTKGDKKVSRAKAQRRWPAFTSQIDHKIADALLIAEWCRLHGDI